MMALQPIEVLPCRINLPTSQLEVTIGNSNMTEIINGWTSLFAADLNVSEEQPQLETPVPLQPPDSLITNPVYLTLTAISIIGNLTMLCVILFTPQFRKPTNYLIVNLSLSSILFILSINLRLIENAYELWEYNTSRCRLLAFIHRIPVPCVALTTMMISLDRGRVARNPMTLASGTPAWRILFIWAFSLIIIVPLAFTRKYDECMPTAHKCIKILLFGRSTFSLVYGLAYLMSVHLIPAIILIRELIKTQKIMKFLKLSNIDHVHPQLRSESNPHPNLPDNRLRLLRNSRIFTIMFLIIWLPYGIIQYFLDLDKKLIPELFAFYIRFYFRFIRNISYVHIALNPVVLFALSYDLRMYLTRVQSNLRQRFHARNHGRHLPNRTIQQP